MALKSVHGPTEIVSQLWIAHGLPDTALESVQMVNCDKIFPSSFKIDYIAQSTVCLSALAAALVHSVTSKTKVVPNVIINQRNACAEFISEKLFTINGQHIKLTRGVAGGVHKASDGYVRIHNGFPHHEVGALKILGLDPLTATVADVDREVEKWRCVDLENIATCTGNVIAAMRSYLQWDVLPQAQSISSNPLSILKIGNSPASIPPGLKPDGNKCLAGLRVIEMSRVISAPTAGRTLAAHGADVLWITAPHLPDIPELDRDFARGKRTIQLDLRKDSDKDILRGLIKEADVFLQSYRGDSIANKGFSIEEVVKLNCNIVYASLSAYGQNGYWSGKRGFDSIVQTCSGMNISEAEHQGQGGKPYLEAPCQVLDHASGYFLAFGILAAVYKRMVYGGAYEVHVALASTMKYLRSLGQFPGKTGFETTPVKLEDFKDLLEKRDSVFGEMEFVRHSGQVEGFDTSWETMVKPLGSDTPEFKR